MTEKIAQSRDVINLPREESTVAPMVQMIERIAMSPDIPIERLEKMLDMKERMEDRAREDEARHAKKAFYGAMAQCQAELPIVTKNQDNTHTRSKYADLAAIEKQAMPIIHAHGFGVSFQPDGYNDRGELQIAWMITHSEGHEKSGLAAIPVDSAGAQGKVNKTGTQAFGSTMTYGRRYLLCNLFNISTGDDLDGNAPKEPDGPITEKQFVGLRDLLEQSGSDEGKFLAMFKIEALHELPASRFYEAEALLRRKIQAKKEAQQ